MWISNTHVFYSFFFKEVVLPVFSISLSKLNALSCPDFTLPHGDVLCYDSQLLLYRSTRWFKYDRD